METKITLNIEGKEQEFKLLINNVQDTNDILWEVRIAIKEELHERGLIT